MKKYTQTISFKPCHSANQCRTLFGRFRQQCISDRDYFLRHAGNPPFDFEWTEPEQTAPDTWKMGWIITLKPGAEGNPNLKVLV